MALRWGVISGLSTIIIYSLYKYRKKGRVAAGLTGAPLGLSTHIKLIEMRTVCKGGAHQPQIKTNTQY
jgi:hypothetical protein